MESRTKVPIAIFLYRRPALVRDLLFILREQRPEKLWLVADGPKNDEEKEACAEARREAEGAIDWPCEVRRVYAAANLGLKSRIETGLDAVFAQEEHALILEEDCHPTSDFFPFCEEMLLRYREQKEVGGVSGSCFLPQETKLNTDYYFSRYLHIWGWATWARAWNAYDRRRWTWSPPGFRGLFPKAGKQEADYWNRIFQHMSDGQLSTWDYGWNSWFWMHGWVGITPGQNLVRNRGFGPGSTHTKDATVEEGVERQGPFRPPYRGPLSVAADEKLDGEVFRNHYLRMEGKLGFFPRIGRSLRKRLSWAGCI